MARSSLNTVSANRASGFSSLPSASEVIAEEAPRSSQCQHFLGEDAGHAEDDVRLELQDHVHYRPGAGDILRIGDLVFGDGTVGIDAGHAGLEAFDVSRLERVLGATDKAHHRLGVDPGMASRNGHAGRQHATQVSPFLHLVTHAGDAVGVDCVAMGILERHAQGDQRYVRVPLRRIEDLVTSAGDQDEGFTLISQRLNLVAKPRSFSSLVSSASSSRFG